MRLPTIGASGFGVCSRNNIGDDPPLDAFTNHSDGMVNEALEAVNIVK
jgi:hypothetical protein